MKISKFKIKNGLPREASAKWGMTLFIAIAVMGILLLITFAIVNITMKATLFASSGRDSQFAFFAADAGMECALYWDSRVDPSKFDPTTPGGSIICANDTMSGTGGVGSDTILGTTTVTKIGGGSLSTFGFVMNQSSVVENRVNHCAIVTVTKSGGSTTIKSRGYNTCDINNTRRVERGIEVTY